MKSQIHEHNKKSIMGVSKKISILLAAGLFFGIATQAQGLPKHRDIRNDRVEMRHDSRDIRNDRRDVRNDRKDIRNDRRDIRHDRRDVRFDRHDRKSF